MRFRFMLPALLILGAALPGLSGYSGVTYTAWAAEAGASGASAPEAGASGASAPEAGASGASASEAGESGASAPEAGASGASVPEAGASGAAASEAGAHGQVIEYSDLPELVKAYSPQVQMERTQYDSRIGRYETAREEIMETRRLLREEADDMEENGDKDGAGHYRAQAKVLEEAAKDMDHQIRSARGSSSTMSLRRMEDTMIWTAQSLMGTYHSLRAEQEDAAAKARLMQSRYDKALRQAALGTVSQTEADEAGKTAQAADNRAQALSGDMERVRKELLMVTGYSLDSAVQIGSMPDPDPGRVDGMSLEVDKWKALGNNYDLRQQRSGSASGNKELHVRQRSIDESEGTMYGQIDSLYQSVLSSRSLWQSACTSQAAGEAEWKAASSKMALGMLSQQEYLEAGSAYLERLAAKAQADVSFQQAMDMYDWAVKGLMAEEG